MPLVPENAEAKAAYESMCKSPSHVMPEKAKNDGSWSWMCPRCGKVSGATSGEKNTCVKKGK